MPEPELEYEEVELTPVRKAIADVVSTSRREIPQFDMVCEMDASALVEMREHAKAAGGEVPSYNDYLIAIIGRTLADHPTLNAHFVQGRVRQFKPVNVGFMTATVAGVLVPVVKDADKKTVEEIAGETRSMIEAARAGKLRASLQRGGTFSLSNIGPGPVDSFNAIILPPQVAILAIGAMKYRPVIVDGELRERATIQMTLTLDHRALDGAEGVPFLTDLKERLECMRL